jgi:hypothetical protein
MDEARLDPFSVSRQPVCWLVVVCAAASHTGTSASAPPATGRVDGIVRLVAPQSTPIVSGAYPTRRIARPAPRSSDINNEAGRTTRVEFALPVEGGLHSR